MPIDLKEILDLSEVAKAANGHQLHSIAAVALNRLKSIDADAQKDLEENRATEADAKAKAAHEANVKEESEPVKEPEQTIINPPARPVEGTTFAESTRRA